MKNNNVFKMTKNAILIALRKCDYKVERMAIVFPQATFLTNRQDYDRAFSFINAIVSFWSQNAKSGKREFPTNKDELERLVDIEIAKNIAFSDISAINSPLTRSRSNVQIVKEAREAIAFLNKIHDGLGFEYEMLLKRKLGEE